MELLQNFSKNKNEREVRAEIDRLLLASKQSNVPWEFYPAVLSVTRMPRETIRYSSDVAGRVFINAFHLPSPIQRASLYAITYGEFIALDKMQRNPDVEHKLSNNSIDFLKLQRAEYLYDAGSQLSGVVKRAGHLLLSGLTGTTQHLTPGNCFRLEKSVEEFFEDPQNIEYIQNLGRSHY